jgi:hypothetical protein
VCSDWLQSIAGEVQGVIAIDGKNLCNPRAELAPAAKHLESVMADH